MDVCEPRVRRRGFFLHSETTGEPDTGEHENPEGFIVRVRIGHPSGSRHGGGSAGRSTSDMQMSTGRSRAGSTSAEPLLEIRSGSVTDSRQRAHSRR